MMMTPGGGVGKPLAWECKNRGCWPYPRCPTARTSDSPFACLLHHEPHGLRKGPLLMRRICMQHGAIEQRLTLPFYPHSASRRPSCRWPSAS
jgi:hypothetical protein